MARSDHPSGVVKIGNRLPVDGLNVDGEYEGYVDNLDEGEVILEVGERFYFRLGCVVPVLTSKGIFFFHPSDLDSDDVIL